MQDDVVDFYWQRLQQNMEQAVMTGFHLPREQAQFLGAFTSGFLASPVFEQEMVDCLHHLLQEDPVLYATLRQLITCTNAQERVTCILDGRPTMLLCAFALAACPVLTRSETAWRTVFALRESVSPASFVPQTS